MIIDRISIYIYILFFFGFGPRDFGFVIELVFDRQHLEFKRGIQIKCLDIYKDTDDRKKNK